MSRPKQLIEPVRLPAMVEKSTYLALINQSSTRSIHEGRLISLAEHVRQILNDAVQPRDTKPVSDGYLAEGEIL